MKVKRKPVATNVKDIYNALGETIKQRRQRLGLTQTQLGDMVELSRSSINGIEAGAQHVLLADALVFSKLLCFSLHRLPVEFKRKDLKQCVTKSRKVRPR